MKMSKNKKGIVGACAAIAALALVVGIAVYTEKKNTDETGEDTIGEKYQAAFQASTKKDAAGIAADLVNQNIFQADLAVTEVGPGYLDGFDAEITGFSKGTKFSPFIGAIPFIGYVFETDDTSALVSQLNANANPTWNICTQADETVSSSKNNLVFFMMCTNEKQ